MKIKNIFTILWTLVVGAFLIWFFTKKLQHSDENKTTVNVKFDQTLIDTLLTKYDYILLVAGRADCSVCDIIIPNMIELRKYNLCPYFIQSDVNDYNLLLSQVLRNKSYPTSYLIDRNGDIFSIIMGTVDYTERIQNVLLHNEVDRSTPDHDHILMLNYSLKGFLCHQKGNREQAIINLRKSLSYGHYFFNNFLMSSISTTDSSRHYVVQAMESLSGGDWVLYQNLIENDLNIKIEKIN